MRIIFERGKQREFLIKAIEKSTKTYLDFARDMKIPKNTLKKLIGEKFSLSEEKFNYILKKFPDLKIYEKYIIEKKEENWGQIKGGKEAIKTILKRYGKDEIKRRQSIGGKNSLLKRDNKAKQDFKIDINDPLFLEFYGNLLGDGWLSHLSYKASNKTLWWVGISGHSELDKDHLMFLKKIIKNLFNKKVTIKYHKSTKGMEIIFCHKYLIKFLNKEFKFPIGKKIDLKIKKEIANDWNKLKYVIRGLFDTDGSLYFDKTPIGRPYPIISIYMKAPILISQIEKKLLERGFKVQVRKNRNEVKLKGNIQLKKFMKEVGCNNNCHLFKYNKWINKDVPVA